MICARFGWILASGSWEEDCLNPTPFFHSFLSISPLRENMPLIWKKNLQNPSPNVTLSQVWLKSDKLFWKRFLKHPTLFPYLLIISRLKENLSLISKNLKALPQKMLFAMFGWNWSNGSEEDENVKTLQWRRHITNKLCSEKLTTAFGLGELENVSLISFE